jgi:hypothetical protein
MKPRTIKVLSTAGVTLTVVATQAAAAAAFVK